MKKAPDKIVWALPEAEVESEALRQIRNVAALPEIKRMVVLPDVHTGYDLPIGCAVLVGGRISPSFVGYDIGCGMLHQNIGPNIDILADEAGRREVYARILERIPVGLGGKFAETQACPDFASVSEDKELNRKVRGIAPVQIGTLGAGNHFIEIGLNTRGEYGITIHSGSRNAGHAIASHYMALGRLFDLDSKNGRHYAADMHWALEYALENRKHMLGAVLQAIFGENIPQFPTPFINENHNHAAILKRGEVLHRKGATPADKGQLGIIPINQRDGAYITKGLGNEAFLCSASHGAGRTMSRAAARKAITPDLLAGQMRGIICRTDKNVCDEGPDAYKDADTVIARQNGLLVEVVDHFRPVLVVKG